VGVRHNVKEIMVEQRFAAGYAELYTGRTKVSLDLVYDAEPFCARELVCACGRARAATVKTAFVALQRKLKKEPTQSRRSVERARVVCECAEVAGFDGREFGCGDHWNDSGGP
jgi:hypothetical protein